MNISINNINSLAPYIKTICLWFLLNLLDTATTLVALSQGHYEGNIILR